MPRLVPHALRDGRSQFQRISYEKVLSTLALIPLLAAVCRPTALQQITVPRTRGSRNFREPPHEFGPSSVYELERPGRQRKEGQDRRDLDRLAASNVFIVNVSPGRGIPAYLSPEHMPR